MLELNNVTISYTNQPAVCNFHLTLGQGEICSIVGEAARPRWSVQFWVFFQEEDR